MQRRPKVSVKKKNLELLGGVGLALIGWPEIGVLLVLDGLGVAK